MFTCICIVVHMCMLVHVVMYTCVRVFIIMNQEVVWLMERTDFELARNFLNLASASVNLGKLYDFSASLFLICKVGLQVPTF